ncbi:MAG: hypothetical protein AB1664_22070 [Thermodesulfobacteriota bacterium]
MASEITYAAANSKLVVIWPHDQSPFIENQADKIYASPDDFLSDVVSGSLLQRLLPSEHTADGP